jgi:hypothetical protein
MRRLYPALVAEPGSLRVIKLALWAFHFIPLSTAGFRKDVSNGFCI